MLKTVICKVKKTIVVMKVRNLHGDKDDRHGANRNLQVDKDDFHREDRKVQVDKDDLRFENADLIIDEINHLFEDRALYPKVCREFFTALHHIRYASLLPCCLPASFPACCLSKKFFHNNYHTSHK